MSKEYLKKYYLENKNKIINSSRLYRNNNKDKLKEKKEIYYQKNRYDILEYSKEYYKNNLTVEMTCKCGSIIKKSSKCLHMRSKKHEKLILEQNIFKNISKVITF